MDVSRRTLIKGGLLIPLATIPRFAMGDEPKRKTFFVVLNEIDTTLSPQLVEQVFETFFSHGIPISAVLRCSREQQDASLNEFVRLFSTVATKEPGLFEVVLDAISAGDHERYFQLREAIDLRDCLARPTLREPSETASATIVSVLDNEPESAIDPYAYRAAGFRVHMHPPQDEGGRIGSKIEPIDWGISRMTGGILIPIEADPEEESAKLEALGGEQVIYISFKNANNLAPDTLLTRCMEWAARLQAEMLVGNAFLTRPMDYLLQGNPGASKFVGLVLDLRDQTLSTSQMAEFATSLTLAGFSYSALLSKSQSPIPMSTYTCVVAVEGSDAEFNDRCIVQNVWEAEVHSQSAQIVLTLTENQYLWSGPRSDGRYHAALQLQEVENFARRIEEDPMTDRLLLVGAEHVATPIQQDALLQQFLQARSDGKVHFYSVQGYVNQTLAPDTVLERYWSTRRRQASDPARARSLNSVEKEELLEDARLAWKFIERYSDEETGICAGTANTSSLGRVDSWVTFWDVASQIEGLLSASTLSIIPYDEARIRIERILEHLPSVNIEGLSLPPSLFRSDRPEVATRGFDSCDMGRFLVVLKIVVDGGLVALERAIEVLDQWDLDATVRDRRAFSYSDNSWNDVTLSHCSHYSRNGYAAWGMPMDTAYPTHSETETGDQNIRLLYQAAFLGRIGAEPFLLEAMELGHSPESRYLSEVLFDAQLSWFEETGQLKCVSEAPLNFAPWFSYQGLRIDWAGAESWDISTISTYSGYRSADFQKRAALISSKAAFLWAANYPHEHSDRLLKFVREKARIEGQGFSVGVFSTTQEAMKDYSDVNTNGIILAAIARMLSDQ